MKAVYITPADLGCDSEYSERWILFIRKFGYKDMSTSGLPWYRLLLTEIQIDD